MTPIACADADLIRRWRRQLDVLILKDFGTAVLWMRTPFTSSPRCWRKKVSVRVLADRRRPCRMLAAFAGKGMIHFGIDMDRHQGNCFESGSDLRLPLRAGCMRPWPRCEASAASYVLGFVQSGLDVEPYTRRKHRCVAWRRGKQPSARQ